MNNLINFVKKNMEDKTDEIRVMIVLQMIVEGIREIDIINFCIDKWGVAVVEASNSETLSLSIFASASYIPSR